MKLLLDTHAYLWWVVDAPELPARVRELIADPDNSVLLSAASVYEMRYMFERDRLPGAESLFSDWEEGLARDGIEPIAVSHAHALAAAALPDHHRDPFDRLLVATALVDSLTLVTCDPLNQAYGVTTIW